MNCIYCKKEITKWQIFLGWFWKLPMRINELSQIWEECCSSKCYELELEKEIREIEEKEKLRQ